MKKQLFNLFVILLTASGLLGKESPCNHDFFASPEGFYSNYAYTPGDPCQPTLSPSTFPGGTAIQGRARWGNTGFEAALYIGGTSGPNLNPSGTPAWVIGTAYKFEYAYVASTGVQTLKIDFNNDNSYSSLESITQPTSFNGKGFQYFSIFMSGDATRSITLNNFVVNGVNLGNHVSPSTGSIDLAWENSDGYFEDILATGTITFTGATGGAQETGRIWFRTATPVTINSCTLKDSGGNVKSTHTTIQDAINAAAAGDRIEVAPGKYREDVTVNKDVELRGANYGVCYDGARGNESTIAGLVTVSAAGASLDGFTLTKRSNSTTSNGINFTNWTGRSLVVTGINTDVKNNIIEMYGGAGGTIDAVILDAAGAVTFECNEVIAGCGYTAEDDGRGVSALRLTNTASNYSISGNHFGVSSGRDAGGDADAVSFFNVGDVDFDGNLVDGNIMGGVVLFGAVDDVTISNNTIKDYTDALAGIRVFNCCGYNSATADVTITGNFVEGTTGTTGIAFRNDPIPAADVLDLSSNSITGNTTAIDFNGTGSPLDATCNWYGTTDVTAIAAAMSGSITYQPFLGSGVDANPAAGFQPSSGSQPGYVTAVAGNGQPISNGSTTYSATNLTLMGSAPIGGSLVRNYSFTSATSCGGTSGATFTSLTFTGAAAARFSFGGVVTGTAYAPGTHNFTIAYTAHTEEIEDEVTCVMTTASGVYTFGLKAVTAPALPAVAQISGNSVLISNGDFTPNVSDHTDFGVIPSPGTLTRTYTITNAGPTGCLPLTLTGGTPITFVGGDAAKFAVTASTCTAPLASGASCTFTVTYTSGPTGGISNTMIRVANSDPARDPYEYSIRAELLSPAMFVTGNNTSITNGDNTPSVADHTFMGSTVAGQTILRSYNLKNLGLGNLNIGAGAVALSAAGNGPGHTNFAVTTQPAAGVYITNQETNFSLTFTSPGQGQFYALVTLTTENAGTFTFVVQGEGPSPRMQVVGNNIDIPSGTTTVSTTDGTNYGSRTLNTNLDRTFTVRNPGSLGAAAPLNLTGSPLKVTEDSPMFSVALQPSSPIDVNNTTTFRIRYRPTAAGCHYATVSIPSNDPARSTYTFRVFGKTTGASCSDFWPSPEEGEFSVSDEFEVALSDGDEDSQAVSRGLANDVSEMALYPNPATDVVLMEVPVSAESRIISFINVSGVTVYSIDTKGGFHSIDLAGFAPGVYAVVSSDRSLAPKRFVKL